MKSQEAEVCIFCGTLQVWSNLRCMKCKGNVFQPQSAYVKNKATFQESKKNK